PTKGGHAASGLRSIGKLTSRSLPTASRNSAYVRLTAAGGAGSDGTLMPIEPATSEKHTSPLRRHSRAGTAGAASGHSERYSAAESSTASSDVAQEASLLGERNQTSGRYVTWLSVMS